MKRGRFATAGNLIETALLVFSEYTPEDLEDLDAKIQQGLDDFEHEDVFTEEEARAYLKAVRAKL